MSLGFIDQEVDQREEDEDASDSETNYEANQASFREFPFTWSTEVLVIGIWTVRECLGEVWVFDRDRNAWFIRVEQYLVVITIALVKLSEVGLVNKALLCHH